MNKSKLSFQPLWADSLGAKTTCTLVETPEVKILIDPGVAVMQPSFPASWPKKFYWKARALMRIKKASRKADVIVISHYHHDHYIDFDKSIYEDKLLLVKNPNEFINDSQRDRAEKFLDKVCREFGDKNLSKILQKGQERKYEDPMESLPHAKEKDFGDYNSRRKELLNKWRDRFRNRVKNWNSNKLIPELDFGNVRVKFIDNNEFDFGRTKLRFTEPLFHGIEFSQVGWIVPTVIQRYRQKFIHTSDINGPTIEDYADWIISENPNVLYLDGPATYLLGFMLNRINLNRAINNGIRIIENSRSRLILYDHHLPRERKFRERTKDFWDKAKDEGKKAMTVAEYLNKEPVVFE
ncbi:MAG: MBL fold metallo-hydrolase [Hadesarchaea archaeon]|nr:MBL fold metallo-hydrolase [Hadesarchaea archaeon]